MQDNIVEHAIGIFFTCEKNCYQQNVDDLNSLKSPKRRAFNNRIVCDNANSIYSRIAAGAPLSGFGLTPDFDDIAAFTTLIFTIFHFSNSIKRNKLIIAPGPDAQQKYLKSIETEVKKVIEKYEFPTVDFSKYTGPKRISGRNLQVKPFSIIKSGITVDWNVNEN